MAANAPTDLEHRALDRALAEIEFLAQKRTFARAAERFAEFRKELEQHLSHEETVTFPDFERRTGDPQRALVLIRAQHSQLTAMLSLISGALKEEDYTTFCSRLDELDLLLKEHQATEERLLPELMVRRSA